MEHFHVLLTARNVKNTPNPEQASEWLLRLTEIVGMKVFFGPQSKRCDVEGNEGVTGLVCIETSHASLHCWDKIAEPFIQCDLYSCAKFDVKDVIAHLKVFQPTEIEYLLIDRSKTYKILKHSIELTIP